MKKPNIKSVVEKNIKNSEKEACNETQIVFETAENGSSVDKMITLSGKGSLKVLMPV